MTVFDNLEQKEVEMSETEYQYYSTQDGDMGRFVKVENDKN